MKPQDPTRDTKLVVATFEAVLTNAIAGHTEYKRTASHALSIGVRPKDLVRYVRGNLEDHERAEVHGLIALSPWALGRVVALVKARRDETSLRYRCATIPILNHYARPPGGWIDEDLEGAKLLDLL